VSTGSEMEQERHWNGRWF